jgi:UDP-GlcNAc:undecaprenyl-phosphate/decaprenyl-phosphate GlcNAc-1-phosphate transferase
MTLTLFLLPALAAAVLSYLLSPLASRLALVIGAVDHPGPRKIHKHPIPRLGGVAVIGAVAVVAAAAWLLIPLMPQALTSRVCLGIALGILPIIAVSVRDDVAPLRPGPKFAAHLAGACIAVAFGVCLNGEVHLFGHTMVIGWLAYPLSVVWLVGMTNAFNIVDGLDGLSAGLALISAFALAGVFLLANEPVTAGAALLLAGGIAGFLPYNTFPARMFFGDTGATAVGFCLAALAMRGGSTLSAGFAALLPAFILGLPIAETLLSMTRRLVRRLEQRDAGGVFEPDRNHMHHRLLALGIEHPRAVFILYSAGVLLAGVALVSMFMSAHNSALLVLALLFAGVLGVRRLGYDEFAIIRNGTALRVYEVPALNRSMFIVFVDLLIVAVAAFGAVMLKTDIWAPAAVRETAVGMITSLAPVTVVVFWRMKLYRGTWRLAAPYDFARACCAVFFATLLAFSARVLFIPAGSEASLFAIYAMLSGLLVTGSRASYQILASSRWRSTGTGTRALIYGAGRKGAMAFLEMAGNPGALRPVAFIDDDPNKAGRLVKGLPVVGPIESVEFAVRQFAARSIVVATDAVSEIRLAELGEHCERLGVALLKLQINFASVGGSAAAAKAAAAAPAAPAVRETADRERGRRIAAAAVAVPARFEEACVPGTRVPIVAGQRCPLCSAHTLNRTQVRSIPERIWKKLTEKRLYRCETCGWRGWTQTLDTTLIHTLAKPARGSAPSGRLALDTVDHKIHKTGPKKRAS